MDGSQGNSGSGAQTLHDNASAARQAAQGASDGCPFCAGQGMPLLLLRYAAIPSYLSSGRGARQLSGTLGDKINDKAGLQFHNYTVRSLRKGFVYVYLGQPGSWMAYAVTEQGHLRLLPDPDDIDARTDRSMSPQCERAGDNIPASFVHIRDIERTPNVWIAFSDTSWTRAVRTKMEADPGKRMQAFDLTALAADPAAQDHAVALSSPQELTNLVEEYATDEADYRARRQYRGHGDPDAYLWDSIHGHHGRAGQQGDVCKLAECYQQETGRHAAALVLHDPLGIVQECNATRLHFVESRQREMQRVMRPLIVSQSILGLKQVVLSRATAAFTAQEQARGLPDVQRDVSFPSKHSSQVTITSTTRAERAAEHAENAWRQLEARYDEVERNQFQARHDQLMRNYNAQIGAAETDWALWAKDTQWLIRLDDYDAGEVAQKVALTCDFAPALAGGVTGDASRSGEDGNDGGSQNAEPTWDAGFKVWKEWLQASPVVEGNPVYRALFGNDESFLEHLLPQDGQLNKGDKLYDALRAVAESDEFRRHVTPALEQAVATLQLAITGAEGALGKSGTRLASAAEGALLRAQQGALLLYTQGQVTLLKVSMTIGEYRDLIAGQVFSRFEQGANVVRHSVQQAGRKVRSLAISGILNIDDPTVRDTVIEVTLWTFQQASDLQTRMVGLADDVADNAGSAMMATGAMTAGGLREARLGLALLGQDTMQQLQRLRSGIRLPASRMLQLSRNLTDDLSRLAGAAGGPVLAAGALFFQGWSLRDSMADVDRKLGSEAMEAQLAVLSPAVGTVGATLEVAGHAMKALGSQVAQKVISAGGLIAAGASTVDAVQSVFAAVRTGQQGDHDASYLHMAAAFSFAAGAGVGVYAALGSSALLGPLGVALALVAIGVVASWAAINAEDTQSEIWLDRCYFGYGERSEGTWTDAQVVDELAALNAIMVGLSVKMGFSDDWLGVGEFFSGYERIDVEIRIANFKPQRGAYEWKLYVSHDSRGEIPALGGRHRVPAPMATISAAPDQRPQWPDGDDPQDWFRNFEESNTYEGSVCVFRESVEANSDHFSNARIEMDYWADYADQSALAHVELKDRD